MSLRTIARRLGMRLTRMTRGWVLVDTGVRLPFTNLGHVAAFLVRSTERLTPDETNRLRGIALSRGVECE